MRNVENVKRLFDVPYHQLANFPKQDAFVTKQKGKWETTSIQQFLEMGNQVSVALLRLGVKKGDKIATITSTNRTEWCVVDLGISQIGAINVPLYPTISSQDYEFILNHSESTYCILSDEELLKKVNAIKANVSSLKDIYSFNDTAAKSWKELLVQPTTEELNQLESIKKSIHEDELATIIYTSGTTGQPKGVMLSHKNIVSNAVYCIERLPVDENAKALSFLPVCHIYERMLLYLYQLTGVSIYFAESLETIKDNIVEVRPNMFTAVPRLLEKVYDGIVTKGMEGSKIKAAIFGWALNLTTKFEYGQKPSLAHKIADKLVYSKIREKLGGNISAIASGSAALQPRLAQFFTAIGIPVYEGYGLTETSPVVSVNAKLDNGVRFGSVGIPLKNVQVKIAEDGEILVKGPNVMIGYYKREDLTKEVLDADGWFHTGDIGEISSDNFLRITDRKKEIFKTSGGKYIAPQMMENKFKESRFIEQIMIIGENQKHPSALIVPSFAFVKEWCAIKGIEAKILSNEQLITQPLVLERLLKEVETINEQFGDWEKVKNPRFLIAEFTIDGGELTPTLKLKRKAILEKYDKIVKEIYG
jgi:long-chain acyl-CoA synthetase